MSEDRELLELAAKAAGHDRTRTCIDDWFWILNEDDDWHPWNPLTDDGDALRLAVKLGLTVEILNKRLEPHTKVNGRYEEEHRNDPNRATRRAIVRAAAEIGRTMG